MFLDTNKTAAESSLDVSGGRNEGRGRTARWLFKSFWVIFLLEFSAAIYDFLNYLYQIDVVFLFKIPLVGLFVVGVLYHAKYRLSLTFESALFIVFGLTSLLVGQIEDPKLDTVLLSHAFTAINPIVSISFGMHFAQAYDETFDDFLRRIMNIGYWAIVLIIIGYLFLYYAGMIPYYGYGTMMHFVAAFLLPRRAYVRVAVGFVLVILSGKRATLVNMLVVIIVHTLGSVMSGSRQWIRKLRVRPRTFLTILLIGAIAAVSSQYVERYDALRRIRATLEMDTTDERSVYLASSGRWSEVMSIIDFMNERPLRWVIGSGMGMKYVKVTETGDESIYDESHYAHFSPFAYVFLYGLPMAVLLYAGLFRSMLLGLRHHRSEFYLGYLVLVVGAFFGSNMFIDPMIWVFVGIMRFMIEPANARSAIVMTGRRQ